jgi:cyclase
MLQTRVMPCLLYYKSGLYKTVKFKNPKYVGDPINAIKIFNEKEVDELVLLDISASSEKRPPDFKMIGEIASECFMPLCYGGGIKTLEQIKRIFEIGVEKVSLNTSAIENPKLLEDAAREFGSQSIIVSIDVKKNFWGNYEVVKNNGCKGTGIKPVDFAKSMENLGAGELLVTSVDKEGTWEGFDVDLVRSIVNSINIPLIANGGAGDISHLKDVVKSGHASAVALGSLAVYQKKGFGVLINFPNRKDLEALFSQ